MDRAEASTLRFGPLRQPDGRTLFRLWAPGLAHVAIEIEGAEPVAMMPRREGWFEAALPCPAGTAYRFHGDGEVTFPDPASRGQKGGVHGWSIVPDANLYRWRHGDWRGRPWHEAVVYELHIGLMGGFDGVRRRLPELAELGITAIELMPIADFPGDRNWGYDGVLPFAPASAYGAPDDLKAMIDEAHGLGLMVLLDVVYNHFGPDGNYLHRSAPRFFREDIPTPWGPAIAFDDPNVAAFFTENALYWLNEFRFDGLRLDAVHAILPREALPALGHAIRAGVAPERHVHLVLENERNDAGLLPRPFDAQWNDDIHHCIHVLLTGENEAYYRDYAEEPAKLLARCLESGFAYQGEHSINLCETRGTPSAGLPSTAFVAFVQNHDQIGNRAMGDRLTTLAEPDALRAAIALVLLCPQIPMIFMGEEIGTRSPFLFFTDHHDELAEAVREGRRNEFRHFQAFMDETKRAAIPDPNAVETFEMSNPKPTEDGFDWRGFYRDLLAMRHELIVPRLTGTSVISATTLGEASVCASWRLGDGSILTLACNLAAEDVALPAPVAGRLIASTSTGAALPGMLPGHSTLAFLAEP